MEENKDLNTEFENTEIQQETVTESKKVSFFKRFKFKNSNKIKNQFLLKKGSYSIAITAIVIAGIIIFNVLVGVLQDRFVLEYDFSTQKENSISKENVDFVKDVKDEVSVVFCAAEETYSSYMSYYAQQYNVMSGGTDYYEQTLKLINKYSEYNKKIKIKYVDTQSSEFSEISSKYSGENITYGDIVVSCNKNGVERHKVIGFKDIYSLYDDQTYTSMGYVTSTIDGNNIENALTSAIFYVTSEKAKKVAFIMGHTSTDGTASYKKLLEDNNYEIDMVTDGIISSVSDKYDAVVIPAPNSDFLGSEIDALSEFLNNDGKFGKGLIFFADVNAPYLTNLYDFLGEWGISVEEGILFETDEGNYLPDDPTTLGSYNSGNDDITSGMNLCITGYNVPLTAEFESREEYTVTQLMATPESTIAAPKGSGVDFAGADNYEGKSYATAIQSARTSYDSDNNEISSYVTAFGSVDLRDPQNNESATVATKNLTLAVAERSCGSENTEISFITKSLSNESFSDSVSQKSYVFIIIIFMFILPIAVLVAGIYIFIKRRNS
ncbi:MAG: GldG family protein [Clostridia bacterium]|nr:GldG family protein [Clostridia bacterium]